MAVCSCFHAGAAGDLFSLRVHRVSASVQEYHNRLMMLCALPYTALIQKVAAKAAGAAKVSGAAPARRWDLTSARKS